jgi:oligopeptide/dipeptide ABC transporter ATP-binding protein
MSLLLITHNLGVIAQTCDRLAVLYAGRVAECGATGDIFNLPHHPYTRGLIASVPVLGEVSDELATIPGSVPNLIDLPPACRFAPRCRERVEQAVPNCEDIHPTLQTLPVVQSIFQTQFSNNYNVSFASYLMAMAPAIVVYLFTQRWVMEGVTQGAVKG